MLMVLDIFSDNNKYVSAGEAAKKLGYASDYVGQLCRSGKVPGELRGRTWYVDFPAILKHRSTRNLGRAKGSKNQARGAHRLKEARISYQKEFAPLLPDLNKAKHQKINSSREYAFQGIAALILLLSLGFAGTRLYRVSVEPQFSQEMLALAAVANKEASFSLAQAFFELKEKAFAARLSQ